MIKIAVLDDYQNIFEQIVDTESYKNIFEFQIFNESFNSEEEAIVTLENFDCLFIIIFIDFHSNYFCFKINKTYY